MRKNFSTARLKGLWIMFMAACAIIGLRLADIQLIRHSYYQAQAERNRTQTIYQTAPRGRFFTADGVDVARNEPTFNLNFFPNSAEADGDYIKKMAADVSAAIEVPEETLYAKLQQALKSGKAMSIADNLSPQQIFSAAELQAHYHDLYILEESKRAYPYQTFASHLIGYMGSMEGRAWKERDQSLDYRLDSKVGRFGLERKFEKYLKGVDGGLFLEVDHRVRVKSIIEDKKGHPGADVHLTLNFKVQQAAEKALANSRTGHGAVVALDPRSGAILAIATAPGFNPGYFVPYSNQSTEKELRNIKEYNLAIQGTYPPASTFKAITALAALEEGKLDTENIINCPGSYDAGARVFKCWAIHHKVNFWDAMAKSCDTFFYILSTNIGAAPIERMQRQFMFGQATEVDLPGERSGNLFGPTRRAKNKTYWFIGDTLNLSIGQGELLVTPIKMAQFAAAIANKGKVLRPYYLNKIETIEGEVLLSDGPKVLNEVKVAPKSWEIVHKALKGVTDHGTGRQAKLKGYDVYTKTGTAQNPHGNDHAWMMAFAGPEGKEPDIAIAAFVEYGESGSSVSGPVVREILKAHFGIETPVIKPAVTPKIEAPGVRD
ncbi:penicillin-binding protein 2 [Elusimicrobium posterum]|uniref:penicillin-binding protein 2 n=1 Tax=Elusimicrobium posterum TaxID=3116653 RepID=UPI003C7719B0